jgi:hypothetical protein
MRICEKLGFTLEHSLDDELVRAKLILVPATGGSFSRRRGLSC